MQPCHIIMETGRREKSMIKAINVMTNMAVCHIKAYKMIHRMRQKMGYHGTKVSFANHVRVFDPKDPEEFMASQLCKNCWRDSSKVQQPKR